MLSIITINYNNIVGLRKTIDSVLSQSYTDYEWIVIDGGSTDGAKELLEQNATHFAYWCSEPDKGIYNAMNKGIAKAQGEYTLFMNSGDVFSSNDTLQQIMSTMKGADIVYADAMLLGHNGKDELLQYPDELTLDYLTHGSLCHQAAYIRTSLLHESGGYDEKYRIASDWKQWVVWLYEGRSFEHLPITACNFDCHGLCATQKSKIQSDYERWLIFEEILPAHLVTSLRNYKALWMESEFGYLSDVKRYMQKNKLYKRIIRSAVHLVKILDK